jgi:hypothetical protein
MTLAKGLGSGLPIGLLVAKKPVMENWPRGAHGNTYGGNPWCCAAALATLDLVEHQCAANAAEVGAYFIERLRHLQARHPEIGDVRGRGLFIGMVLVKDRAPRVRARRITPEEAQSVPKIMAAVMSWHDAKPLLEQMDGPEAPAEWQGGLPITYRMGGGRVKVHLKVDMDNSVKPNYVVEARLRGADLPDEWVLVGNHRDAWEFGGVDPSSGTASMLELTRALGEMARKGSRPRRTIIACSWDGEEVGLTGSTEWGEQFATDLARKLVAYLNVDSSASGPNFQGSAVGSLAPLLVEASRTLADPSGTSLYEAWKKSAAADTARFAATGGGERKGVVDDESLVDTRIGSGSDHTVFLNALGRPVIGLTFDGPYRDVSQGAVRKGRPGRGGGWFSVHELPGR